MSAETSTVVTESRSRGEPSTFQQLIRVAVLCDYAEEQWPSMDLMGDMLCSNLANCCGAEVTASRILPSMRRRLSRGPLADEKRARNVDRLINRFIDYPRRLRNVAADHDLFHLVDHSYSQLIHRLPPGRTVVTCHDLDTFGCLLEPKRENRPRWFRMMTQKILDGFQQAAHVIAVSAATRDELLMYGLIPPERISVVLNGVHPSCSALDHPASDAALAALLPKGANEETLWVLNVGSSIPRKRLDVLLRVFAAIVREIPEARLLRVGGAFTPAQAQLARELNVEHAITLLPFLDRDVLASAYRRSAVLVHTAEAEGFGLPLIEAMACGCPVVASDVPVLREVGGAAASYCPVASIDIWKETAIGLLRQKKQQSSELETRRQRGFSHAARYSWADNARQTAGIYRKVWRKVLDCK